MALKHRHGAVLFLDEAHAFGVIGPTGMGLAEQLGVQPHVDFQMGTLSKAAGLCGGYLAASRPFVDLLVNRARSFVYSTAPPPAVAHAALAALAIIRSPRGASLRASLLENARRFASPADSAAGTPPSAIHPVLLGSNEAALAAAATLDAAGFLAPAIRYPTVPRGTARLRVSLSAAHPPAAVDALARKCTRLLARPPHAA